MTLPLPNTETYTISFNIMECQSVSSLPQYFYSLQRQISSKSRAANNKSQQMWLRPRTKLVQNWNNKMTMMSVRRSLQYLRKKARRSNQTMVLQHQTQATTAVHQTRHGHNIARSLSVRCSRAQKKSSDNSRISISFSTTKMRISKWPRPCK